MDVDNALALVLATSILVAIPGPNVALIVANTLARGAGFGVVTVLGTTTGVALQLALVVLGLSALLQFAAAAFVWIKWIGVAYLVWLGVRTWRRGAADVPDAPPYRRRFATVFWQGLMLATINPKTLLFVAAFLPQFVGPGAGPAGLAALACVHLSVVLVGDLIWAVCAGRARPFLRSLGRLRHRLTGGLFIGAGLGLALARIDR